MTISYLKFLIWYMKFSYMKDKSPMKCLFWYMKFSIHIWIFSYMNFITYEFHIWIKSHILWFIFHVNVNFRKESFISYMVFSHNYELLDEIYKSYMNLLISYVNFSISYMNPGKFHIWFIFNSISPYFLNKITQFHCGWVMR